MKQVRVDADQLQLFADTLRVALQLPTAADPERTGPKAIEAIASKLEKMARQARV